MTQLKLFPNCGNWNTRQETIFKLTSVQRIVSIQMSYIVEYAIKSISMLRKLNKQTKTVFKPNNVYRIVSLSRNCKKTSSKSTLCKRNSCIVKKFENAVLEKQAKSMQMSISILQKKARSKELKNSVILQKDQGNAFQNQTISKESLYYQET